MSIDLIISHVRGRRWLRFDCDMGLVVAILSMLLVVSAYSQTPGLHVFGHDEVHYNNYYKLKLLQDGRWLNYIFVDYLAGIDVSAWFFSYIAGHLVLFYRMSRRLGLSVEVSCIISAVASISPPVVEQSMWPATAFSAVVLLIVAEVFSRGKVSPVFFYPVLGVFLFGSMQSYYFIAPLMFVGNFIADDVATRERWLMLFKHVLFWILGAIVGAIAMSIMLLLLAGHFGPEVDGWRASNPVSDFPSLLLNVKYVAGSFLLFLGTFDKVSGVSGLWLLAPTLVVFFAHRGRGGAQVLIVLMMVLASFHAFSAPLAPVITMRSLVAMMAAIIFLVGLSSRVNDLSKLLVVLFLLVVGFGFQSHARSFFFSEINGSSFIYEKVRVLLPSPVNSYEYISVDGYAPPGGEYSSAFNNSYNMNSVARAIGFKQFRDCRVSVSEECMLERRGDGEASIGFGEGKLRIFHSADGGVVLVYSGD